MHKLYLMRHADAPMSFDMHDKVRPLSDVGILQAKSIAPYLGQVDRVLCSSATRTKMTCEALIEAGAKFGIVEHRDDLYNASVGVLLEAIQATASKNILMIAHNPGIHALANYISKEDSTQEGEKLKLFYHPATLSVFNCEIESWAEIKPHQNQLVTLTIPD